MNLQYIVIMAAGAVRICEEIITLVSEQLPETVLYFKTERRYMCLVLSSLYVCMTNTILSLALWKHHVNLLLQSFRFVSSDLY